MTGESAVTSISELLRKNLILFLLSSVPSTECCRNLRQPSARIFMECSTFVTATGRMTLSSKLPWLPASATVLSLPITCMAIMISDSHWVGLTLPGMMEEPGSFSGSCSSASPQRGPAASQRMSLAILMRATASPRNEALKRTMASCEARAMNLLGSVTKGLPVILASSFATASLKPAGALSPVPTAVPPRARG